MYVSNISSLSLSLCHLYWVLYILSVHNQSVCLSVHQSECLFICLFPFTCLYCVLRYRAYILLVLEKFFLELKHMFMLCISIFYSYFLNPASIVRPTCPVSPPFPHYLKGHQHILYWGSDDFIKILIYFFPLFIYLLICLQNHKKKTRWS